MTDHPPARHAFITNPERQIAVLNVAAEDQELQRFNLTRDQLFALNAKTADILMKDWA